MANRKPIRRKKKNSPLNNPYVRLFGLAGAVILVVLVVIIVLNVFKKDSNDPNVPESVSSETTVANNESNADPNNASSNANSSTAASTAPTQAPKESLPAQKFGTWDLASLPNDSTPFGNSPDQVDKYGVPNGIFFYEKKWGQYNVDFISQKAHDYEDGKITDKIVYLTMDCGFDNEETGPILDTLKAKNVKATFFVTSMFYDARPDLIKRMIDEGHRIGSHTINHYTMPTLSIEEQTTEIMDVVNKLKKDFNYDCRLFRFPTGTFSDQCLALVENLGLKSVFWSYAYNDYSATQPPVQESYEKAVKYLHPGALYLLHASSSTNRAFLGDWIDAARAQGYEFGGVYPVD